MTEKPVPPAGWYNDPSDPTLQRYWDGAAWTQQVAPLTPTSLAGPEAQAAVEPPSPAAGLRPGVVVGLVVGSIVALVLVIAALLAFVVNPMAEAERAREADAAAQRDAAALGHEIAWYWATGGGPPPEISVKDGYYVVVTGPDFYAEPDALPTVTRIPVSPGVEFGGNTGASGNLWCVWVTAPNGEVRDYKSTTLRPVDEGSC
ncbi:MAG: hypothetical protein CVT64_11565 [Actinobacteria bacterium HGW-Actinobacteria-4]|nr:MAG: hypothetical protein CVT64_11565 [Actinobacteria bacterium HGW-Actinobacteria-4]